MNYFFKSKEEPTSLKQDMEDQKTYTTFGNLKGVFNDKIINPISNKTNEMMENS